MRSWMGILLALVAGAGCAHAPESGQGGDTFKQGQFLYKDTRIEDGLIAFVDTDLALRSANRSFIPLYVAMGNRTDRRVALRLQDMTLRTPSGRELKPAPYAAVRSQAYGRLYEDRRYIERRETAFWGNAFANMWWTPAFFYPEMHFDPVGGVREEVQLGPRTYMMSLIYFPREAAEAGAYTFTVRPEAQLEASVTFPLFTETGGVAQR